MKVNRNSLINTRLNVQISWIMDFGVHQVSAISTDMIHIVAET